MEAESEGMVKESDETWIHSQGHRLKRRTRHLRRKFSGPKTPVDSPLMPASKPTKLDTSSPSKIEVTGKIGFPKGHKTPGPHGLSMSFFKVGGELLTLE